MFIRSRLFAAASWAPLSKGQSSRHVLAMALLALFATAPATAGQREAPAASRDPSANVTDLYAFRSWADPSRLVLLMNVFGSQHPGDGPIYGTFDDSASYRIHVDNDRDGRADDVVYEFTFRTENRAAFGRFTFSEPYVGHPNFPAPELRGITALDGPGSEGLTLRQTYSLREIRNGKGRKLFEDRLLVAVPPNVGPTTTPNYEQLAAQGIYRDRESGIRVFVGPRAETFYSDTGALFDTATVRRFPPILSPQEDESNSTNPFGFNRFAGTNVQSMAIEVPINRVTHDRRDVSHTQTPVIGVYASASRKPLGLFGVLADSDSPSILHGHELLMRQISRVGNPMINTILIDTQVKDRYNSTRPEFDAQYANLFADPSLTREPASAVFGIPVPPPPRADLLGLFLKYAGQPVSGASCGFPCADLLRLDLRTTPTQPENQKRMGSMLGGDPAGLPNGRRPNDDATDFAIRIIGGPALIGAKVSDGVNFANGVPGAGVADGPGYGDAPGNHLDVTANGIVREFPFMPTPHSGLTMPADLN